MNEDRLEQVRRDKARMEAARAEGRRAEAVYHEGVRGLHEAGASAAEIARALDIGEEAVRRIVGFKVGSGLLRCSFCSKTQKKVRKLIAGPGVYICDACTAAAQAAAAAPAPGDLCSFCGKSGTAVRAMAPGPDVSICDECLDLCREIIREEAGG